MLSNRTANFQEIEKKESLIINNNEKIIKQFTAPIHKFDFLIEEEKVSSSFSFKDNLLDKKAYKFIKSKDECLAIMNLDDRIPNKNEEHNLESDGKNNKERNIEKNNSDINN